MKRTLPVIFVLLTLLACNTLFPTATPQPPDPYWQDTVTAVGALQPGSVPQHLQVENAAKQGGEFDPNQYFTALTHLSMEPGWVLDYVYHYDSLGGFPVLYARLETDEPFATEADYWAAVGDTPPVPLDHVQSDGTEQGYYEVVVFRIMAGQFYLFWHAGYNDLRIVADSATLESILADPFGIAFEDGAKRDARAIDLEPRVEIGSEAVTVRVVTFTHWGGFYEQTFTLNRAFPHTPIDVDLTELVPYESGIQF